jgi:hypothetical protein
LMGRPKMKSGVHVTSAMFVGWSKFDFVYLDYNGNVCLPVFAVLRPEFCVLKGCRQCQ